MIVEARHTAVAMGSGDMAVLATPAMVALMEGEAMRVAAPYCQQGQTTVGVSISVEHIRATLVGAEVGATARLVAHVGRKLTFEVEAFDNGGQIGCGTHERMVVDGDKFMAKLQK